MYPSEYVYTTLYWEQNWEPDNQSGVEETTASSVPYSPLSEIGLDLL